MNEGKRAIKVIRIIWNMHSPKPHPIPAALPAFAVAKRASLAGIADLRAGQGESTGRIVCRDARGVIGRCEAAAPEWASSAVSIALVENGNLCIEREDGPGASFGAGAMLLCLGPRPLRGHGGPAHVSYVQPSAQGLAQLLHALPAGRRQGVEPLQQHGLAPFLVSQFDMLQRRGDTLAPTDLAHVVHGIFQTAGALLKGVLPQVAQEARAQPAAPVPERLGAVLRFIERNLHRQDLGVADIATGTLLSRSNLYRLFDDQALSVSGTLREARLQMAMHQLTQARSQGPSIGAIAHACGFSDQAVFGKLFRRRFGMTPRQARSRASAQPLPGDGHVA